MKNKPSSISGVALVIVLGFLVILSALAVAFFSSVTTELKGARTFSSGVSTRQLADSAANVVMAQIREATTRENGAWASQPGMIRVYRDSTGTTSAPSSRADAFIKLYSSDKMIIPQAELAAFVATAQGDYDTNYDTKPAFWTDLNAPVVVRDPTTGADVPHFPIIDPSAWNVDPFQAVQGFDYQTGVVAGTVKGGGDSDRVPMPVRWIYVLQDGTLTVPTAGANAVAQWLLTTDGKMPTKDNPIVGRIAFWTDDDTNKVNINTAAGFVSKRANLPPDYSDYTRYFGSYWDTPRFMTNFDRGVDNGAGLPTPGGPNGGLALTQLLMGEFQRYPGHPATTSLGGIFGAYLTSEDLWRILPRISTSNYTNVNAPNAVASSAVDDFSYGTRGGIKRVAVGPAAAGGGADNQNLLPKSERLYASPDELLFATNPNGMPFDPTLPTYQRQSNDAKLGSATPSKITPQLLDRLRFFLTASSRAPELNLFGRPRVTIWPVRSETVTETTTYSVNPWAQTPVSTGLNPFDRVMLFCSTIGQDNATGAVFNSANASDATNRTSANTQVPCRYIFFRRNPYLYSDTGTAYDKMADVTMKQSAEAANNGRNYWLLSKYLTAFTEQPIPGFGGNFKTKLDSADAVTPAAANRDQLLLEIFDYVRCANITDTQTIQFSPLVPNLVSDPKGRKYSPLGIIAPAKADLRNTGGASKQSGFGRFPAISEVTLVFYYAGPTRNKSTGIIEKSPVGAFNTQPKYRQMRAFLLFSTFNPMQGYGPLTGPTSATDPRLWIKVEGLNQLQINAGGKNINNLDFPASDITSVYQASGGTSYGRNFGGYEGFMHTLAGVDGTGFVHHKTMATRTVNNVAPFSSAGGQEYYPFQTGLFPYQANFDDTGILIPIEQATFDFKGNTTPIKVSVFFDSVAPVTGATPLQTINLTFPDGTGWPVPMGDAIDDLGTADSGVNFDVADPASGAPRKANRNLGAYYWGDDGGFYPGALRVIGAAPKPAPPSEPTQLKPYQDVYYADPPATALVNAPTVWSNLQGAWSFASRLACAEQPTYDVTRQITTLKAIDWNGRGRWHQILQPGDTVRSMIYCDTPPAASGDVTKSGDLRLSLITNTVQEFKKHPDWNLTTASGLNHACLLRTAYGNPYYAETLFGNQIPLKGVSIAASPKVFPIARAFGNLAFSKNGNGGVDGVIRADGQQGDFDTGIGIFPDGPFVNKQDEGNVVFAYWDQYAQTYRYPIPYFGTNAYEGAGNTFYSPMRQMPSALMMGSLPRRAASLNGWETLCFTPKPLGANHPGNVGDPKDHLLLDLFSMPVVEPYPISEPFSTAGKINMNYRIVPFDYITRTTGIRAALAPIRVTGVPQNDALIYKTGSPAGTALVTNYRNVIDCNDIDNPNAASVTLNMFDAVFNAGLGNPDAGLFKSATQICEVPLCPIGIAAGNLDTWWNNNGLTGDNVREKPYADLYPRLTTKSNTYTVHFRVQTLRQIPRNAASSATAYAIWEEGKDNVLGEYRGATTIERYIDPSDSRFSLYQGAVKNTDYIDPDTTKYDPLQNPATPAGTSNPTRSLELIYRFRTVMNKKFAP